MRRLLPLLVLLAPLAAAGTPDDPEIVDPTGDASPPAANQWGDLTAAWFEAANDTVVATVQVSSLLQVPPMTAYLVLFDMANESWYAGIVFVDVDEPLYYVGPWDREAGEPTDQTDATGKIEGTRLTVEFAAGDVDAEAGATFSALEAGVFDYKTAFIVGAVPTWLDKAQGQRDFTLETAAPDEGSAPAGKAGENATPAAPVALLLAGAGAVAAARRRR